MQTDTRSNTAEESPLKMVAHAISDLVDHTIHGISAAVRQFTASDNGSEILQSLPWRKFKYFWKSEGVLDMNPAGRRFSWSEYQEYIDGMRAHCRSLAGHGMAKHDALFLYLVMETRMRSMLSVSTGGNQPLFRMSWSMQRIEKQLDALIGIRMQEMISSRDLTLAATAIRRDLQNATPIRIIAAACARVWRAGLSANEYAEYMDKQAALMEIQFRNIINTLKRHPRFFSEGFIAKTEKNSREMKRGLKEFRKRVPGLTIILEDLQR